MNKKIITAVSVVIINNDKKVLIAKRPLGKVMPNRWEFPGGKLEGNETLQECGIRETKEELSLDVSIDECLGFEEINVNDTDFCLHIYTAYKTDECQILKLNVHTAAVWVDIAELPDYDFLGVDLPFIKKLKEINV
ncbi:(deoxy)nucleoside triphosphate pyrophosphohydrolase [Candidatus Sulfurimonas marisnigri]|uniref:8-oxo-dGTP diphosphatase n=1 Tax=Candidatus Sulfurimonas marisnigri TaxID=2740405 RepID=A0A7S7LZA5_9BACT|nr:(deoxy)nucleoside triphosphate pyrophosphohydrolase [Candidatus Sulfurimonas marisnigri]QOY54211.1 (deoxy)nucleoside triphosphate pyrophosphohydrolase [Candidatus Sulfurimonas marisnigri]